MAAIFFTAAATLTTCCCATGIPSRPAAAAQEDPEVLRCWARLGNEIQILKVYEKLEEVGV